MIDPHFVDVVAAHVHDSRGFYRRIPADVRDAIATVASDEWMGIQLLVWTFGESSWNKKVKGDCYMWEHNHTLCVAWRTRGLGGTPFYETPDDALGQVRLIVAIMAKSARVCPAEPLAQYAGGCTIGGAIKIARDRTARVNELFSLNVQPLIAF